MDPNLYHLDWERTAEALAFVVVLAFIVERALAVLFETRFWIRRVRVDGVKEIIAVALSIAVCFVWDFDAVSMVVLREQTSALGYIITGLVIAGGSKASLKLFREVLGIQSSASRNPRGEQSSELVRQAEEIRAKAPARLSATAAQPLITELEKRLTAVRASLDACTPTEVPWVETAAQRIQSIIDELHARAGADPGAGPVPEGRG